jgi:hypothetical protein
MKWKSYWLFRPQNSHGRYFFRFYGILGDSFFRVQKFKQEGRHFGSSGSFVPKGRRLRMKAQDKWAGNAATQ